MSPSLPRRPLPAWLPATVVALSVAALEVTNLAVRGRTPHAALDAALLVVSAAPLLAVHRFPFAVGVIVAAAVITLAALGAPHLGLAALVALYGIAALSQRPTRIAFAAAAVVATILVPLLTPDDPADIPRNLALYGAAWLLGTLHRQRNTYTKELEHRAALLLAQREENARLAADVERGRIARELHDVIAHALSVMIVQTGAARAIGGTDPERADGLLAHVERVGRDSLAEVRHVLGRLRTTADAAPLAPRPGLAGLDGLLRHFADAGLPVGLTVTGTRRPLRSSVDGAAYRIIQESLTNALKHAEHPTRVTVSLAFAPAEIAVKIIDNGARTPGATNGGHGLRGIRERAELLGGSASAGRVPGGGFRVAAVLPDEHRP